MCVLFVCPPRVKSGIHTGHNLYIRLFGEGGGHFFIEPAQEHITFPFGCGQLYCCIRRLRNGVNLTAAAAVKRNGSVQCDIFIGYIKRLSVFIRPFFYVRIQTVAALVRTDIGIAHFILLVDKSCGLTVDNRVFPVKGNVFFVIYGVGTGQFYGKAAAVRRDLKVYGSAAIAGAVAPIPIDGHGCGRGRSCGIVMRRLVLVSGYGERHPARSGNGKGICSLHGQIHAVRSVYPFPGRESALAVKRNAVPRIICRTAGNDIGYRVHRRGLFHGFIEQKVVAQPFSAACALIIAPADKKAFPFVHRVEWSLRRQGYGAAFRNVNYFAYAALCPVGIKHNGNSGHNVEFAAVLAHILIIFFRCENCGKQVNIFFQRKIVQSGVARYVGKIPVVIVFFPFHAEAQKVIALLLRSSDERVLRVRLYGHAFKRRAIFVDYAYRLFLISLVKADIARYPVGISIRYIFFQQGIPIYPAVVFKAAVLLDFRICGKALIFYHANCVVRLGIEYIFIKAYIIVVQNIYIYQIPFNDPLSFAHRKQLDIAAVTQSEQLRTVGIIPVALIPRKSVTAAYGKFHLDVLGKVEIISLAYPIYTAQVVAGKFHIQICLYGLPVCLIIVIVVLFSFRCRRKHHIIVLKRSDFLFPHCGKGDIFVGHNRFGIVVIAEHIAPTYKRISFALGNRQGHKCAHLIFARLNFAVAAVYVKGDRAISNNLFAAVAAVIAVVIVVARLHRDEICVH